MGFPPGDRQAPREEGPRGRVRWDSPCPLRAAQLRQPRGYLPLLCCVTLGTWLALSGLGLSICAGCSLWVSPA